MARRATGLQVGVTLDRPVGTRRSKSLVAALSGSGDSTESPTSTSSDSVESLRLVMVDPARIAPHPRNPRVELGDLDGLTASIRDMGVRQPVLVVSVAALAEADPEAAAKLDDPAAEWVLLAGHRRRAAAIAAGAVEIPAIVEAQAADVQRATATFVAENVHRADLSPIEEARAYAVLVDAGQSQRAVAALCGVSQSHISKRMQLLTLPIAAQDLLTTGELDIGDALALAGADERDREAALAAWQSRTGYYGGDMQASLRIASSARAKAEVQAAAEERAAAEGIELWPDNHPLHGYNRVLRAKREIAAAKKAGTLAAAVLGGQWEYMDAGTRIRQRSSEEVAAAQRRAAAKTRGVAVAEAVRAKKATSAQMIRAVTTSVLRHGTDATARAQAHKWLGDLTPEQADSHYEWTAAIEDHGTDDVRLWVAWAITLASIESSARSSWGGPTAAELRYYDWLAEITDWRPGEWEQARIAAFSPGDSVESPTEGDLA